MKRRLIFKGLGSIVGIILFIATIVIICYFCVLLFIDFFWRGQR